MMATSGLCGICAAAPAVAECSTCGTAVCGLHYDRRTDRCRDCVGGIQGV